MPRFAIGNLTIDVDVPPRFRCEYTLNGSLIAESPNAAEVFELSALTLDGSGVDAVLARAAKAGLAAQEQRDGFVSFFQAPRTWFAGFGPHVLIATLTKGTPPEFAAVLSSVAPAHDAFIESEALQLSELRPSHTRFFEQRRTSLLDAIAWSPQRPDAAQRLDTFWNELLDAPPDDKHLLATMLSGAAVAFGDLLSQRGFQWALGRDAWGTSLGVVALRGTANVWVVPDDFLAKRWEAQERDFFPRALDAITAQVEKMRSEWKQSVS